LFVAPSADIFSGAVTVVTRLHHKEPVVDENTELVAEVGGVTEVTDVTEFAVEDDSLVEDVSIDGMCGVY
jgi:mycofactocin precursor